MRLEYHLFIISVVWSPQTFLIDFCKTKGCWKRGKIGYWINIHKIFSNNIYNVSFWCNLKVGSLFASDNSEQKIIFSRCFVIFLCNLKSLFASDNSEPKIIFRFFLIICQLFWCNLKVGSLFGSDNSERKIIFFHFFSSYFGVKNSKI